MFFVFVEIEFDCLHGGVNLGVEINETNDRNAA